MRTARWSWSAIFLLFGGACGLAQQLAHPWAIEVHGGAGVIERKTMDAKTEAAYRASMAQAIGAGAKVLDEGGSSLDAVEATIKTLEDDPLFNAGRGAVFTAEGKNELDAAIMDGATLKAGAVAGVTRTRHPISLARAVMEKSPHVMLIGAGADAFAGQVGLEQVDPIFFFTERRWQGLVKELKKEGLPIPPRPAGAPPAPPEPQAEVEPPDAHKYGTVGVVALDKRGDIAAGTSTGGTQAKKWGRVGDCPNHRCWNVCVESDRAPCRRREQASISSGSVWRVRFAISCTSAECGFNRRRTKSSTKNWRRCMAMAA